METKDFEAKPLKLINETTEKKSSLLKSFRGYKIKHNFDINRFRLIDQSEFRAMKKALYLHEKVCSRNDCVTCVFYNAVKSIYYINNDLPKYNFGHHDVSDIQII